MTEVAWEAQFLPQAADGLFTLFCRVTADGRIVLQHCDTSHFAVPVMMLYLCVKYFFFFLLTNCFQILVHHENKEQKAILRHGLVFSGFSFLEVEEAYLQRSKDSLNLQLMPSRFKPNRKEKKKQELYCGWVN